MKAIALISGGLDSILAAKIIKDMNIDVMGVYFRTPFDMLDKGAVTKEEYIRNLTSQQSIDFQVIDLGQDFLDMVKKPKHGFGANVNPCIDCRIYMLKKAKQMMLDTGASFLVTGEVLGQRQMSQHLRTMLKIDKEADVEGINLRPLCAKHLEETIPEKNGWVDRNNLFDFAGRGRRNQIDLAITLGIVEFAQPAGGCLLTDVQYAKRFRDLLKFGTYDLNNIELLKYGRHFKLADNIKLIVGRNLRDNDAITRLSGCGNFLLEPPEEVAGPTALVIGQAQKENLELAAAIVCRYCDKKELVVSCKDLLNNQKSLFNVAAIDDLKAQEYRI